MVSVDIFQTNVKIFVMCVVDGLGRCRDFEFGKQADDVMEEMQTSQTPVRDLNDVHNYKE